MAEKTFEAGETWISPANDRWNVVCVHTEDHLKGWVTLDQGGIYILRRQNDTMFWRKVPRY